MSFEEQRRRMVELHLAGRGIADPRVLSAFRNVPRESFVPDDLKEFAYEDAPLPIGEGQTISQPYIVAVMVDALRLRPGDRVLEIGTGSGYAAAILSRVAAAVFTMERIESHAERARERLAALGYENVHVRHGDGTRGWPDHAPYEAIVVAAGGPVVPEALLRQLAPGGRLVIPVGADASLQTLVRVTRDEQGRFRREDLSEVRFVPLIGEEGWTEEPRLTPRVGSTSTHALSALVREAAVPLRDIDTDPIDDLVGRLAEARIVCLGEATHGTSEFYRMRARISRELIDKHGFDFIAIEGDWPDTAIVDAYVLDEEPATRVPFTPFERFPTWMWRNQETHELIEWLREHNREQRDRSRRVGFHGLDLYSLFTSIAVVLDYLEGVDPEAARIARGRYGALTPWQSDPAAYGRAVLTGRYRSSETAVVATLRDMLERRLDYARADGERFFDAAQNARVVANAERYYRAMYYGSAASWNLRDNHMFDTLESLLGFYGPDARAIVWAHNSHVGDATATEMGARGELNLGQLCRARVGEGTRLVGFGTHHGTVAAAEGWGEPMQVMRVRPSHERSYERIFHDSGVEAFTLQLRHSRRSAVHDELLAPRLQRAIGVVYRPETELASHYFQTALARQFDELIWFDETQAIQPLRE